MKKQVVIALPTYNEAKNIKRVLQKIRQETNKISDFSVSILVLDDNSPDKTWAIVQKLQKNDSLLFLLRGKKEGLGRAYIRGFEWILKNFPSTDYVFKMDADLSHDPRDIKRFLKKAEEGFDMIIGSRYIKGGGTPDWKIHRRILSFSGNQYIRVVGGMRRIHDCTSGFRCVSMRMLRKIDFDKLHTRGYAFLMSFLHQVLKKGGWVAEIPIIFKDRTLGKSKLSSRDARECFAVASSLRLKKY